MASLTQVNTRWMEIKEEIKSKWGKLTDDEIEALKWNLDPLVNKIQALYGFTKAHAEWEFKEFKRALRWRLDRFTKN